MGYWFQAEYRDLCVVVLLAGRAGQSAYEINFAKAMCRGCFNEFRPDDLRFCELCPKRVVNVNVGLEPFCEECMPEKQCNWCGDVPLPLPEKVRVRKGKQVCTPSVVLLNRLCGYALSFAL